MIVNRWRNNMCFPEGYRPLLGAHETEKAIKDAKDTFERELSGGPVCEFHLEEHAVFRFDPFEDVVIDCWLQTVPVFGVGRRSCAPAVELNIAVVEELQIPGEEKSGGSGKQKKRCDFFHEETSVLSRVVKRAEFFPELSGLTLADAQADFRFLNAACVRGEAEPDIE